VTADNVIALRYPWLWAILGWMLVIGVCVGSLVPSSAVDTFSVNDKLLHAGAYFLLMVWFAGLYRRRYHGAIAAVLLALGIVLDTLQTQTVTRSFELADIAGNAVGIVIGFALSVRLLEGWCQRLERWLFVAS
jgi:VanZ family protein